MIIGIIRMEALINISLANFTYTGAYALVWSFTEPGIGISVACAPFFRPIVCRMAREMPHELEIELANRSSPFLRIRSSPPNLPSFSDPNIRVGKGRGKHGSYITTQFIEPGNWSTASQYEE